MKDWCFKNEMRVNEDKSGILHILKQSEKIGEIENDLNISEVNSKNYLGVQLDQSLRLDNHQNYIKQKVLSFKRRIHLLKPSLINQKVD